MLAWANQSMAFFGNERRSKKEILSFFDGILVVNNYLNSKND
jgi:hypothetical protein